MKKTLLRVIGWSSGIMAILVAQFALAQVALADAANTDYGAAIASNLDLSTGDPVNMVVEAVNWVLGILALVAVIMVLIGGFKWMTAGGNEERVDGAKKLLVAAIIGLVIILAAWGISLYAVDTLGNVTNNSIT